MTENTQALKQLFSLQPAPAKTILTNCEQSQNQITESYRYLHLQNDEVIKSFEFDQPYPQFSHPEPIEPPTEKPGFISIRQSLGNTGLNELGLMLALVGCSQHYNLPNKFTGSLYWYNKTRIYWPSLTYAPFAKRNPQ